MKKLLVLLMALFTLAQVDAQEKNVIRIATDQKSGRVPESCHNRPYP